MKEWGLVATSFVIVGLLGLGRFLHCPVIVLVGREEKGADYSFRNIIVLNYSYARFRLSGFVFLRRGLPCGLGSNGFVFTPFINPDFVTSSYG